MRILIVEDDRDLNEGLTFAFTKEGYLVESAANYCRGMQKIKQNNIDVVILDCNLPDGSGFDFCKEVREQSQVPVIMLTARDAEVDELEGLEMGADDYITKPFSIAILKMRVLKALRKKEAPEILTSNGIRLDISRRKVFKLDEEVELSPIEWQLLFYLISNEGKVLLKQEILNYIWDKNGNFVDENAVSVNIRRLRVKIENDPSSPQYIKAVRGFGYRWNEVNE